MLFSRRVRIRIRVRIRFSVWLVSCYAHVFVLLLIVIVTLPSRSACIMDGIANHFPANKHDIFPAFAYIQAKKIFRGDTPDPCRSAPGAWTQTLICARLASVPIVPISRNDHWFKVLNGRGTPSPPRLQIMSQGVPYTSTFLSTQGNCDRIQL